MGAKNYIIALNGDDMLTIRTIYEVLENGDDLCEEALDSLESVLENIVEQAGVVVKKGKKKSPTKEALKEEPIILVIPETKWITERMQLLWSAINQRVDKKQSIPEHYAKEYNKHLSEFNFD